MSVALPVAPAIRFHLSLNVSDLARSVGFYRTLFGREPAKLRGDYAKFELDDPPVVLSLEPAPPGSSGALNHLGFRMPGAAALVAMQQRLEGAGIRSRREEGVECCYARQTKFWVHDPDGTLWEIYTLDGDLDHRGAGQDMEAVVAPGHKPEAPAPGHTIPPAAEVPPPAWEHRLGEPVPVSVPLADGSVAEVRLRGSFNLPLAQEEKDRLLREAARVLRPGGRLFVHVLVADRCSSAPPALPGPAAFVRHVPLESEPLRLVEAAGFQGI
ncbi:MAG TPA: ArsI/CadI family heavy metal resistance metalloenzyme, partial [Gemmataceae bacterium]|nr:ArsI/CadI family heavy metal resistance metalloenzyme [Gemmataceae bacterium]